MKFIDEVTIHVKAGNGGAGCLSFRREKFVPFGGPDGGDGGDGGSIFLKADSSLNTLIEFRYKPLLEARNGQPGMGKSRRGKSAEDLIVSVPLGTVIYDADTQELIGELTQEGELLCVAQGGFHGIGNERFKSSTQRAPRITTPGTPGESRNLKLELKILADVGLLGAPNAGKSTFISHISNATPKIADYPFTTLKPHLGVVRLDALHSFVIADLPGLIEGAHLGAGLGIQFLKHLSRCKVLLHLVDVLPTAGTPEESIKMIIEELAAYSAELLEKPRWLVFNKIDLLPVAEVDPYCKNIVKKIAWKGPVYKISAVTGFGVKGLCQDVLRFLSKDSD